MGTKIDLDEIERKALAISSTPICKYVDYSDYIDNAGPLVTLALIARIRELERFARSLATDAELTDEDRAILEKGTVLP